MTCGTALQTIAYGCLEDLKHQARAVADGDADALHRMRIALTRLRTALRFFAPAIDSGDWTILQKQAAWLSRRAGAARDIDVALQHQNGTACRTTQRWRRQRQVQYERLGAAIRSVRYRRFIVSLRRLTSRSSSNQGPADQSQSPVETFSIPRLQRWQLKLIIRGRKLKRLDTRELHRLRLRAKRLKFALEWSVPVAGKRRKAFRSLIVQASLLQNVLGKLNDAATHNSQAKTLGIDPISSLVRISRRKSQRRLLKTANGALKKLRWLKLRN